MTTSCGRNSAGDAAGDQKSPKWDSRFSATLLGSTNEHLLLAS